MKKAGIRSKRVAQDLARPSAQTHRRGTSAQLIYQNLRNRILALEMPAHTDVNELDLVNEFSVSRTPIREALIRLSSEGLVTLLPNKGAQVAPLDADDVSEILEALELAQRVTARWAAVRRTEADLRAMVGTCKAFVDAIEANDYTVMSDANRSFHSAVGRACGNRHASHWYDTLLNSSMRLARLAYAQAPLAPDAFSEYHRVVDLEHRAMVEAIDGRDAEASDRLARQHAALFRERILRYMARNGADDIVL